VEFSHLIDVFHLIIIAARRVGIIFSVTFAVNSAKIKAEIEPGHVCSSNKSREMIQSNSNPLPNVDLID
jgi:hypothetical protein